MKHSTGKSSKEARARSVALALFIVLAVVSVSALVVACEEGPVQNVVTDVQNGYLEWSGNGSGNNCEAGGSLHWILTPGGNVTLVSGTLHVEFADNTSGDFNGYFQGQNQGALHFDSVGSAAVVSASVSFTYVGDIGNAVLTISHSVCNTTTTEAGSTTTESPTTTVLETTTTVVGSETTVTSLGTTTTAVRSETTVTTDPTTSTVVGNDTTTTVVGSESTSTTVRGGTTIVTAGRIDTGGGGTAGSGGMAWLVVGLLGSAMVALGWSSARSMKKAKASSK
jgi:hypothetical protein